MICVENIQVVWPFFMTECLRNELSIGMTFEAAKIKLAQNADVAF